MEDFVSFEISKKLKDKLKDCDKEVLIDIITEVCNMYVGARMFGI